MLIALFANGILVAALSFVLISVVLFSFMLTRKLGRSFIYRKPTNKI